MYWIDSREQHGAGRRAIQQNDQLRGGLGGGYGGGFPLGGQTSSTYGSGVGPRYDSFSNRQQDPYPQAGGFNSGRGYTASDAGSRASAGARSRTSGVANLFEGASDGRPASAVGDNNEPAEFGSAAGVGDNPGVVEASESGGNATPSSHRQSTTNGVGGPAVPRYGRGRRHIEPEDHQAIRDYAPEECYDPVEREHPHGRRAIQPEDHLKEDVLKPIEEIQSTKPPSNEEMKDAIRDWIEQVHGMMVADERKWADAIVKYRGCHWCIEGLNERRVTLSREGPSAKAIAEKLSMMPVAELRHFGVRFCGANDVSVVASRAAKAHSTAFEDNPTLVSPGVHTVLGRVNNGGISVTRKEPDAVQRRYIASGKDNFESIGIPLSHGQGHKTDTDFSEGMERGVGHGKRHISTRDTVQGLIYGGPR